MLDGQLQQVAFVPLIRFDGKNVTIILGMYKITSMGLTGFLVREYTCLQLLGAGEGGDVRVSVGALHRNVEKFASQHVGRSIEAA